MISEILDVLKKDEQLYGWNLKAVCRKSYQLFFIKQELDMNREIDVSTYQVTVFKKLISKDKEFIGSATFQLYSSMDIDEIKEKIEEQKERCKYTSNEMFTLPKKQDLKPISKDVEFDGHTLKEAAFIAADALFEADKYDKGYINSSEIYIIHEENRYFDSNNNVFLYCKAYGTMEFVVTWVEKQEEIELYKYIEFDKLDSDYIQSEANKMLVEASNRIKAVPTPDICNCRLVLENEYVKNFFSYFLYRCWAQNIYDKTSNVEIGMDLQKNSTKADKLSIRLEPTMKNSTKGLSYDVDGLVLKKNLILIDKGVVKNIWGGNAVSQHISVPVNGTYSNMIVNTGTLSTNELANENYLQIVALSDFGIDKVTGDFGSEIRLAYLYNKNKAEKTIVTGGSISGNVNDMISSMRFSVEAIQINNYLGPKCIMLDKVKFLGAKKD